MKFKTGGELLKQIRKTLGITQRELSLDKINHNTISRIESNSESINYILAMRLSENINYLACKKDIHLNINALDLLETEQTKCEKWCKNELKNIQTLEANETIILKCDEILDLAQRYNIEFITMQAREISADSLYK